MIFLWEAQLILDRAQRITDVKKTDVCLIRVGVINAARR